MVDPRVVPADATTDWCCKSELREFDVIDNEDN
jgi:hypothetical protein